MSEARVSFGIKLLAAFFAIGGSMIAYLLSVRRSTRRDVLKQHPQNKNE